MHYLDNAATTKVDENVIRVVATTLHEHWGNPSSLYKYGMESEKIIKNARGVLAKALGCAEKEFYFTSCGTESNNLAILGAALARKNWADNIVCTGYEHPSVEKCVKSLERYGYTVTMVNPNLQGIVDTKAIIDNVTPKTALVCAMQVNNEIGSIIDVNTLAEKIKAKNSRTAVHIDGVQGFLKLPFSLKSSKIDSYSISAHKLYAPKGIGGLYLRSGHNILPPYQGGGQENGVRPGTENIAFVAGFAETVKNLYPTISQRLAMANSLKNYMATQLASLGDIYINSPDNALPYNFNFSCMGIKSEIMLHHLESYGVCVSSGSACSKGKGSHTLIAMGMQTVRADGAIRVSIGKDTTKQDIDALLEGVASGLKNLAKSKR